MIVPKGLSFLEAVKVLQVGGCREITCGRKCCVLSVDGIVDSASLKGIIFTPEEYLGDWSLIGAKYKKALSTIEYAEFTNAHEFINIAANPTTKVILEWEDQ